MDHIDLDMDGVPADFNRGVRELCHRKPMDQMTVAQRNPETKRRILNAGEGRIRWEHRFLSPSLNVNIVCRDSGSECRTGSKRTVSAIHQFFSSDFILNDS